MKLENEPTQGVGGEANAGDGHDHGIGHSHVETVKSRMSYTIFILAALGQLATVLLAYWLIAPDMMRAELKQPGLILLWTFLLGVPCSLFEYLYHRYLLHAAVLPFMAAMQRAHRTHHGLTDVKAPVRASDPDKLATVHNEYPVEEEHQEDSMKFPLFSGLIFEAVFVLLLGIPIKLLLPGQPIIISLIFTVMLYYSAYEIWHGILHLPFERFWKPRLDKPVFRHVYGFHLMHHWRPTSNLAIVGLWGVALWDHVFATHHRPERMPLHNAQVSYMDAKLPQPRWPISMFDRWQGRSSRASRRLEDFLAAVFLRRGVSKK